MDTEKRSPITVGVRIRADLQKVWNYWTEPKHVTNWCFASDDWHAPYAENEVREGGKFKTTMAAKDGSMQFDFEGIYDIIELFKSINYTLLDGRKVSITFEQSNDLVEITEIFEPEVVNSLELQKLGWQAILDNFKKYVETMHSIAS